MDKDVNLIFPQTFCGISLLPALVDPFFPRLSSLLCAMVGMTGRGTVLEQALVDASGPAIISREHSIIGEA